MHAEMNLGCIVHNTSTPHPDFLIVEYLQRGLSTCVVDESLAGLLGALLSFDRIVKEQVPESCSIVFVVHQLAGGFESEWSVSNLSSEKGWVCLCSFSLPRRARRQGRARRRARRLRRSSILD